MSRWFGLAAVVWLCVVVPAASAAPVPMSGRYVTDGSVLAVALDGSGRTYLGGEFSQVGPRTGHGIKLTSASGAPASGFADVAGGRIDAIVSDGAGGWFVGGNFTAVEGVSRSRLAHIKADGTL